MRLVRRDWRLILLLGYSVLVMRIGNALLLPLELSRLSRLLSFM